MAYRGMEAVELKSVDEVLTFPDKYEHCAIIFLADWCGACNRLKETSLQGIKDKFMVEGVPLGIANHDNLSEDFRKSGKYVQGWPTLLFFMKGKHDKYEGPRTGSAFYDYIYKRLHPQSQ